MKESYFARFLGKDEGSVLQEKTQLEKQKGDKITFGLIQRLDGAGVTGTQPLEGNEEELETYDFNVELELYRHAVRTRGSLDEKRPVWDMPSEARSALKVWGTEKIDALTFAALQLAPSKIFYNNSSAVLTATTVEATAKSALTNATNSLLTLDTITKIKTWARTGGNRTQTPIRPVRIDGKEFYIMLVHPDVFADIKMTSEYKQANREARERGQDNPLFRNADFVWDGVIVHEHENVSIATDGGAGSQAFARNLFLGAQAGCWAWGKRPYTIERDFDYGEKKGYSWNMMAGVKKSTFNSKDYGVLSVYSTRTNISGL
jgi:N4-gp56 family major capsid protein